MTSAASASRRGVVVFPFEWQRVERIGAQCRGALVRLWQSLSDHQRAWVRTEAGGGHLAPDLAGAIALAAIAPTLEPRPLQDAILAAIATRRHVLARR